MPEAVPAPAPAPAPRMRRAGFWWLAALVLAVHLLLSNQLLQDRVGWGHGEAPPPRIDVAFVRELQAAAPPTVAPVAVAAPAEKRLAAVAQVPLAAASAPAPAASMPAPEAVAGTSPPAAEATPPPAPAEVAAAPAPPEPAPPLPLPPPPAPLPDPVLAATPAAPPVASAAAVPAPAAASATAFDWPPSTRMTYLLKGYYRGPVEGSASVEWRRQGLRYQVQLETSLGPLMSRRSTSEGELTAQGLAPRRFDGEQKVLFRGVKRWQLRFGPERVVLIDGREVDSQPGVQDEASQFVQLTWLFTTQPERLAVGQSVEMPLAISRKLDRWIYDVVGEERLYFPFGSVPTFHLKPRREAAAGDLTAEIWIAPSLQYLPVRILVREREASMDLTLDKPPLQAAGR